MIKFDNFGFSDPDEEKLQFFRYSQNIFFLLKDMYPEYYISKNHKNITKNGLTMAKNVKF